MTTNNTVAETRALPGTPEAKRELANARRRLKLAEKRYGGAKVQAYAARLAEDTAESKVYDLLYEIKTALRQVRPISSGDGFGPDILDMPEMTRVANGKLAGFLSATDPMSELSKRAIRRRRRERLNF